MKYALALCCLAGICVSVMASSNTIYTLRGVTELDRSAAAWVYKKFVQADAVIVFADKTNIPANAISFDFMGASIERRGNQTAFESMIEHFKIKDAILLKMIPLLRDIEINKWGKKKTAEAPGLIAVHNGFVFQYSEPKKVMESDWMLFDALYAYFNKTKE